MDETKLLKLADLLEADAANQTGIKFDLGSWGNADGVDAKLGVSCGTTACAVGLACLSGAFLEEGLGFETEVFPNSNITIIKPTFGGYESWDAVEDFFGLREAEAQFLFDSDSYPDEKTTGAEAERFVAGRIRDFVAGAVSLPESLEEQYSED